MRRLRASSVNEISMAGKMSSGNMSSRNRATHCLLEGAAGKSSEQPRPFTWRYLPGVFILLFELTRGSDYSRFCRVHVSEFRNSRV